MKDKIAITTSSFAEYDIAPISLLKGKGFDLSINKTGRKLRENEILDFCADCVGIVAGTELYDRVALSRLKVLKVISRCGVGVENIDMQAAKELKIEVVNTPFGPTLAVAELTVGVILSLLRNISISDAELKQGIWNKRMGNLINGKNIGIIGFGRIGQKAAELLSVFGAEIAYYDINPVLPSASFPRKELSELLPWADILSIHCSSERNSRKVIGKEELRIMKKGAILINMSRGGIVDEKELFLCLKNKHLSKAALDAFEKEPYSGKLIGLKNVILTPHIGSYAKESRVEMEMEAANNLLRRLKRHR